MREEQYFVTLHNRHAHTHTGQTASLTSVLIELHVPDFDKTKEYYQKLGFIEAWQRQPEGFKGYMILQLEQNILCFWAGNEHVYDQDYFKQFPKNTPKGYGVEIVLMVEDIKRFYETVKEKIEIFEPLQFRPWGLEDFRVVDPFGFYLRFTSLHNILDPKNAVK